MIHSFYVWNGMSRYAQQHTLEQIWKSPQTSLKIISMDDEEDEYLNAMQLMLGAQTIIPFQKLHDDYWSQVTTKQKDVSLAQLLSRSIWASTDGRFLDYMISNYGDLTCKRNQREKKHWSQEASQLNHLNDWSF